MKREDDSQAALTSFAISFVPQKHVLVAGDDQLADALRASGIALVSTLAERPVPHELSPARASQDEPVVNVLIISGGTTRESATQLLRHYAPTTTLFLGEAAPLAREVLPQVEEFTIREGRVQPRELAAETLAAAATPMPRRLHLACGPQVLPGWVNIDNQPYPGVDRLLDLREGLPFRNAQFVYAEHFVEHIEYTDALALFAECRRVLSPSGVLRISTPNLDWVWSVAYHPAQWTADRDAIHDCLVLNRAFRGWGHRFLYNWSALKESLLQAGFATVTRCTYGESAYPELRGIERHEQYPDVPELPHVLVAEASGLGTHVAEDAVVQDVAEYLRDLKAF